MNDRPQADDLRAADRRWWLVPIVLLAASAGLVLALQAPPAGDAPSNRAEPVDPAPAALPETYASGPTHELEPEKHAIGSRHGVHAGVF